MAGKEDRIAACAEVSKAMRGGEVVTGKQIVAEAAQRAADSILDVKSPTACLVAPIEYEFAPCAELIEAAQDWRRKVEADAASKAYQAGLGVSEWPAFLTQLEAQLFTALAEVEKMLTLSKC